MEKKEKSISIEGIILNKSVIETIQHFQQCGNDGINSAIGVLTSATDMIIDFKSELDVSDESMIRMLSEIKYLRNIISDLKA